MISLVLECSTLRPGLALFRDEALAAEREWEEAARGGRLLFEQIRALLQQAGIAPAEIGRYICGRGPGIFSSLRMAFSAAQAAALPGGAEIYALSSGEALAWEWIARGDAERVAVAGDARRGQLWVAVFGREGDRLACLQPWRLVCPEALRGQIGSSTPLLSVDAERLRAVVDGPVVAAWPRARFLGEAALRRLRDGVPSEEPLPLYMHPAVDLPKVDASG